MQILHLSGDYNCTCYSEIGCPLCVKSDPSITDDREPQLHIINGCTDGSWEHCLAVNKLERAVIGNAGWGRVCLHCDLLRQERRRRAGRRRWEGERITKKRCTHNRLCCFVSEYCLLTRIESGPSVMTSPMASIAWILRGVFKGKLASKDAPKAAMETGSISSEAMTGTGGKNKINSCSSSSTNNNREPWIHEELKKFGHCTGYALAFIYQVSSPAQGWPSKIDLSSLFDKLQDTSICND